MSKVSTSPLVKRLCWGSVVLVLAAVAWWSAVPLAVSFHTGRARQHIYKRADEEALSELRAALRLDTRRANTFFLLARVHRRLGNLDFVPVLLTRATELGGDKERAQREGWLAAAQAGQLRISTPHLAELLSDPRDDGPDICQAYAQGFFTNLRVPEALEILDAWKTGYPNDALAHFMEGYLLQSLEREEAAVAAYRRGLALNPHETKMRYRLAQTLTGLREFDAAHLLFQRCAEETPEDPDVLAAWADCKRQAGSIGDAKDLLEKAIKNSPAHFESLRMLGEVEILEGNFHAAAQYLRRALELRPYDTTTHNAMGKSLRASGQAAEAKIHFDYVTEAEESLSRMEQQLQEAVERPDDVELRYDIGTTLLKYGAPQDGVRWLKTVLEIEPDHQGALQTLATYSDNRDPQGTSSP